MLAFEYHKASVDEVEALASTFCWQHGDDSRGIIPASEFDRLFVHLADALRRHGSFVEVSDDADSGRWHYVDQIPSITIVPQDHVTPAVALAAALEAVGTSHRPLAVSFDFYPEVLLVLPPNRVFTTFAPSELAPIE